MSLYYLLLFKIILNIIPTNCQSNLSSHNIIDQYSYYSDDKKFNNSFIDFTNYKVYKINRDNIIHKNENNKNFQLEFNIKGQNKISLQCINEACLDIELSEHNVISFDFDRMLSTNGGIYSYILIIYGLFSLKRGYTYINLSFIFYGSFGFLLFIREICHFLELNGLLSTLNEKSEIIVYIVFYLTLIISLLYGFVCHFYNLLKYITLGFIEGILLTKIFFFLLLYLKILNNNLLLKYFIVEVIIILTTVSIIIYCKNKYPKFTIFNIAITGGFGIIFAVNVINGGFPFIPYLILASKYEESTLYEKILNKNIFGYYAFLFLILLFCGIYWSNSSYNKLKSKMTKLKK